MIPCLTYSHTATRTNRYNGPGNGYDVAIAVAVDQSGNAFVAGWSEGGSSVADYATIKYSGAGVSLWTRRYNEPANANDYAAAMAVDRVGNTNSPATLASRK